MAATLLQHPTMTVNDKKCRNDARTSLWPSPHRHHRTSSPVIRGKAGGRKKQVLKFPDLWKPWPNKVVSPPNSLTGNDLLTLTPHSVFSLNVLLNESVVIFALPSIDLQMHFPLSWLCVPSLCCGLLIPPSFLLIVGPECWRSTCLLA